MYSSLVRKADLLICADGGTNSALARGWRPDIVVGDMDSLDDNAVAYLRSCGCELIRYPRAKDETDLELALSEAVQRGATNITVLGALGGRIDHTLANILLLALPALSEVSVRILEGDTEIVLVRGETEIRGRVGDTVSLIPIAGDAVGVTTEGLEWALHGGTLRFSLARGVSNVMISRTARIKLREGLLLAIHMPSNSDEDNDSEGGRDDKESL